MEFALILAGSSDCAARENDDNSGTIVVAYRIGKRTAKRSDQARKVKGSEARRGSAMRCLKDILVRTIYGVRSTVSFSVESETDLPLQIAERVLA